MYLSAGVLKLLSQPTISTGEASKLMKISQQTVIRLFDDKKLGGRLIMGSKFRLIDTDDVFRVMRENKIPFNCGLLEGLPVATLISQDYDFEKWPRHAVLAGKTEFDLGRNLSLPYCTAGLIQLSILSKTARDSFLQLLTTPRFLHLGFVILSDDHSLNGAHLAACKSRLKILPNAADEAEILAALDAVTLG